MPQSNLGTQDPFQALEILKDSFNNLSDEEPDENLPTMSLVDHLQELRTRIFACLIAVVVGSIVAFIFRGWIIHFLSAALPTNSNIMDQDTNKQLVTVGLTEGFTIDLLVSLSCGIALGLPVVLYQIWAFVAPGLYDHEKKAALPFIFLGVGLFAAGVSLGYLMLQYPVMWFVDVAASNFITMITASSYFQFVVTFFLAFGLIFEIPLVLIFLARVGIVSEEVLKRRRAVVHFAMWVVAAFITPGADLYSPIILAAVMSGLYELSIVLIRHFVKKAAWPADEDA
jgi:sec-independent protein translocase protein TatC